MVGDRAVRIFVAMPSVMGENSPWSDIDEIRHEFLEPISREIGKQLGVSPQLVIEDDGPGYASNRKKGMGSRLINGFVAQLGGTLDIGAVHGTKVAVSFPID